MRLHADVPCLATVSIFAAEEPPIGHDAAAEAGAEGEQEEVFHAFGCAKMPLTEGAGVAVFYQ